MTEKNNKTTIIALSLVVVFLVLVIASIKNTATEDSFSAEAGELSPEVVADKMVNYINDHFLQPDSEAYLVEVLDEGSVYRMTLSIEGMEFDSFASKDGMFLFPEGYDLTESPFPEDPSEEVQTAPTQELSDVDPEELALFVECLKDADFVIYGANWCGWTTRLVDTLGGQETVSPIYIECTEKEDLCSQKEIRGYPTILVKDEPYQGDRTFEGFSKATGCLAPEGSQNQDAGNPAGGC